jgi:hypothetical protein
MGPKPKGNGNNGTGGASIVNEVSTEITNQQSINRNMMESVHNKIQMTPMLEYANARSNYDIWSELVADELGREYGQFADFTTGTEWKPTKPTKPVVPYNEADPESVLDWDIYKSTVMKAIEEGRCYRDVKTKMFYHIKTYLSEESKLQLARKIEYPKAIEEKNPVMLWHLIKVTHSAHQTGVKSLDLANAYYDYETLRQRPDESIGQYMTRFQRVLNTLHILKHPEAPKDGHSIAAKFKKSLDTSRYRDFIIDDDLAISRGDAPAEDIAEISDRVQRYMDIQTSAKLPKRTDAEDGVVTRTAFVTDTTTSKKNSEKGDQSEEEETREKVREKRERICVLCKSKDHPVYKCPYMEECSKLVTGNKIVL